MTSFGWKRKSGVPTKKVAAVFSEKDDDVKTLKGVDWLSSAKKPKLIIREDAPVKSQRLKDEGALLAENGRNWEALKIWNEAIILTPKDSKLHEMKAQALMQVGECFPAVVAAETAVACDPTWWVAHQTLGRTQLGIGQLDLAVRSFSKAVHLNPGDIELRKEDLEWAVKLLKQQRTLEEMNKEETVLSITEVTETEDLNECSESP